MTDKPQPQFDQQTNYLLCLQNTFHPHWDIPKDQKLANHAYLSWFIKTINFEDKLSKIPYQFCFLYLSHSAYEMETLEIRLLEEQVYKIQRETFQETISSLLFLSLSAYNMETAALSNKFASFKEKLSNIMFQVFVDPLHSAGNNNNTGNRATCFHLSIALKTRSSNSLITCIFQRLIIFTC